MEGRYGILKKKKELKITFTNPNTEEQIVQAMAGMLAYNLSENNEKIRFDYSKLNSFQNSHEEMEDELEMKKMEFAK